MSEKWVADMVTHNIIAEIESALESHRLPYCVADCLGYIESEINIEILRRAELLKSGEITDPDDYPIPSIENPDDIKELVGRFAQQQAKVEYYKSQLKRGNTCL